MTKDKHSITRTEGEAQNGLATRPAGGAMVEGRDPAASISRLAMYQGTAEEEQTYGPGFKRGDWVDTLEKRNLGPVVKIIPVAGWMSWAKWEQGAKVPVYSVTKRSEVPPEELAWTGDGAVRKPPTATECVNLIVLVNDEPYPFVVIHKRTGLKAYQKVVEPYENRHGHSVYEYGSVVDKNTAGQPYQRLTAKPCGPSNDEQFARVTAVKNVISAVRAKAEAVVAETGDEGGDNIPI